MAKNYANISAWFEDASKARSVASNKARFDLKQRVFYALDKDGKEYAFPLRFTAQDYVYSDFFRAVLNFATGTVTPVPMPLTYADPIRDIGVASLVKTGVQLANKAAEGLKRITESVTNALDAGVIPASLYQEIESAKQAWVDASIDLGQVKTLQIRKVRVNLIEGGKRIIYPVRLRAGNHETKVKSRIDPGAEMSVISPALSDKLQAPVSGTAELGGFTGGNVVVPVVRLEALVGKNKIVSVEAAVSELVKQQTGKDFLVGVDLFLKAKDAGELMI